MPNPTTKQELLAAMNDGYAQLYGQVVKILKTHQKFLKNK